MNNQHINNAVAYMRALMEQGWEYPDASAKAAVKFKVAQEDLGAEYELI